MKPVSLPPQHYAANWSTEDVFSLEEASKLGYDYAILPDGPEKEAKFLEIARTFHGYLIKYLFMICRGHLPLTLTGSKMMLQVHPDTKRFVQYFLPKGVKMSRVAVMNVWRNLHPAFKAMETEDIYDILMEQLLRAAAKYDPFYCEKVGKVVKVLNRKERKLTGLSGRPRQVFAFPQPMQDNPQDFTIDELNKHLEFDGTRFVRVLCRHGFLAPAPEEQADGVRRYRRAATWPPPAKYLAAGQIGFAYYLQMWFRYYLQQHIESSMSEIETKEGIYSLDFQWTAEDRGNDGRTADALGAVLDRSAKWWSDKETSSGYKFDLSQMNLAWVAHTEDPIFTELSRRDRYLLYLVFARELKWEQVADALQISLSGAKYKLNTILSRVRSFAALTQKESDV